MDASHFLRRIPKKQKSETSRQLFLEYSRMFEALFANNFQLFTNGFYLLENGLTIIINTT